MSWRNIRVSNEFRKKLRLEAAKHDMSMGEYSKYLALKCDEDLLEVFRNKKKRKGDSIEW